MPEPTLFPLPMPTEEAAVAAKPLPLIHFRYARLPEPVQLPMEALHSGVHRPACLTSGVPVRPRNASPLVLQVRFLLLLPMVMDAKALVTRH